MFGLGMPELLIILVIALLVFGAGRLPEIGNSLGRAIRGFKEASEKPEPPPSEKSELPEGRACPKCGKAMAPEAAFCPGCGTKLSDSA
jgi:sec-independent protein translocase protein TatA